MNRIWYVFVIGIAFIIIGLNKGRYLNQFNTSEQISFIIDSVYNANGRKLFPDYRAIGKIEGIGKTYSIEIFEDEYLHLKPKNILKVFKSIKGNNHFIYIEKYNESMPLLNLFGILCKLNFITQLLYNLLSENHQGHRFEYYYLTTLS